MSRCSCGSLRSDPGQSLRPVQTGNLEYILHAQQIAFPALNVAVLWHVGGLDLQIGSTGNAEGDKEGGDDGEDLHFASAFETMIRI